MSNERNEETAIINTILSFLLAKRRDEIRFGISGKLRTRGNQSGTCVQRLIIIIIIIFFEITFYIKYGFQKGSLKKYKIHSIREDVKKLKYVKTIKMYKTLTQIHLNYIFKKITFKNI